MLALRVFLCAETQNDTYDLQWPITYHFFTKLNFHTVLMRTVHTVYKYKVSQCCNNF
jgi:hypothetical protein